MANGKMKINGLRMHVVDVDTVQNIKCSALFECRLEIIAAHKFACRQNESSLSLGQYNVVFGLLLSISLSFTLARCQWYCCCCFSTHPMGLRINIVPLSNRCWKFAINSCDRARSTLYTFMAHTVHSVHICCFFACSKENKNKYILFPI